MDAQGNRPDYREAIRSSGVLMVLAPFSPRVVGTPPLGIAMPDSDIDIVCQADEGDGIARILWDGFADAEGFAMRQWTGDGRPVVTSFRAHGWLFEIFAARQPVETQAAWRHFVVERRLLAIGGEQFRQAVMREREDGAKTEPAFAAVLGLTGDPYAALLELSDLPDAALMRLLIEADF